MDQKTEKKKENKKRRINLDRDGLEWRQLWDKKTKVRVEKKKKKRSRRRNGEEQEKDQDQIGGTTCATRMCHAALNSFNCVNDNWHMNHAFGCSVSLDVRSTQATFRAHACTHYCRYYAYNAK